VQVLEAAISSIPDLTLDSKLLVESQLLHELSSVKEEPMDDAYVDSLDQMMCKIVDDMT
jgi:hypothetical protein